MLSRAAIDAAFAPLEAEDAALVALSGGPDSTALLFLLSRWTQGRARPRLFAATVDHGLRPEASTEAAQAAALCAQFGVPHATLKWEGAKPKTRVQERAREARYRLLARHARAVGAGAVVTAHHADDQAETILFRLVRGSGLAGLAGMTREGGLDGLRLVRPLLDVAKSDLVAICREAGLAFSQDPSNADPRYARTRMRSALAALAADGLTATTLTRLGRRLRRADEALAKASEVLAAQFEDGALSGSALLQAPPEIALRALTILFERRRPPGARAPRLETMERLEVGLRKALSARAPFRANAGGLDLTADRSGNVRLAPEAARKTGSGASRPRHAAPHSDPLAHRDQA